jgi:hypothetical protein
VALPATELQLTIDPATRSVILLVAVYLVIALGGVLAHAYEVPFARLGLLVAALAGVMLVQMTLLRAPVLFPVALAGLTMTGLASRSIRRERRAGR